MTHSHTVTCCKCGDDCTAHHFMCDQIDREWCASCFPKTPCGRGEHGEGCATQVFDTRPDEQNNTSTGEQHV